MSEHFIRICVRCSAVIAQCRCPSKDKRVEHGVCAACVQKERDGVPEPDPLRRQGITLWRDIHDVTQPGDEFARYDLRDLHATLVADLPVWPMLAWYAGRRFVRKVWKSVRGIYTDDAVCLG
jgi:hypothetical protein